MKALASRPFCPCKGRPGKLVVISRTVQGHDPLLSLGYDMTQPLLAGIVTALGGRQRGGQAMGLNVFTLFTGFGIGSFLFGEALRLGFGPALAIFSAVQLGAAVAALPLFRSETASRVSISLAEDKLQAA